MFMICSSIVTQYLTYPLVEGKKYSGTFLLTLGSREDHVPP